jgi:hypothetical protein
MQQPSDGSMQRCAAATLHRGNAATLQRCTQVGQYQGRGGLVRPLRTRAQSRARARALTAKRAHAHTRSLHGAHARAHERRYIKDSLSSLWPDDLYAKKSSRVQPLSLRVSTGTHRVLTGYSITYVCEERQRRQTRRGLFAHEHVAAHRAPAHLHMSTPM